MQHRPRRIISCVLLLVLSIVVLAQVMGAKDEKLKPEQVIAKHLESIGSPEKLKEIKNRATNGTGHVDFRVGGSASLPAEANLVSEGSSIRFSMRTPALEYPGEQFVFDGNKVDIGQISPGRRSNLGEFIFVNDELLKDGLLFGTLSTSWTFLNMDRKQPKLDLSGPKKVDGKSVYEMKYIPKRGSGNITAFFDFDAETFRHVRSQFKAEIVPTNVGQKITDSAETIRYTITETFDDFKQVDALTLPHSYKLDFSIDTPSGGFVGNWSYTIRQVSHNQNIDRQVFSLN
jgi:hypothetical protein